MTRPVDRFFPLFERGRTREDLLRAFRESLRGRIDPETESEIDERTIALVTAVGGRFHTEADAIDLVGMAIQQRAITMLGNMRPVGSTSSWLREFHGPLRGDEPLPATGGAGLVLAKANAGVIWTGSTTAGDPFAVRGTDAAGNRYQVVVGGTTPVNGQLELLVKGLDTGEVTNLPVHDPPEVVSQITWENPPVGAQPTATVATEFQGGAEAETDEDFAQRLEDQDRYEQPAGNSAQIRALARGVPDVAVDDAFVYACALHAGSFVVSFLIKRPQTGTLGPLATIPQSAQLIPVRDRVVPPGSPEIPERAYGLVVAPVSDPTDVTLKLSQRKGSGDGWTDAQPWPLAGDAPAQISGLTDQQHFELTTSEPLPNGVTAPAMMLWNATDSRWVLLNVESVTDNLDGTFDVVLGADPSHPLAVGRRVSPAMSPTRALTLAKAVEAYVDTLGPGEIVPADDTRRSRAARFPEPPERPYAFGQEIVLYVQDALGAAGAVLVSPDPGNPGEAEPPIPSHPTQGPGKITLNRLAVYPLS